MATYKSQVYVGGAKFGGVRHAPAEISASITIPAGTALAASDILKFFKVRPNTQITELSLVVDSNGLFDGAAGTIDIGTDASATDFVSASTALQSANKYVRLEATGTDGAGTFGFAGFSTTATRDIQINIQNAGTQTTADDTARTVTLTAKLMPVNLPAPPIDQPAYLYEDRYNSSGVSSV